MIFKSKEPVAYHTYSTPIAMPPQPDGKIEKA